MRCLAGDFEVYGPANRITDADDVPLGVMCPDHEEAYVNLLEDGVDPGTALAQVKELPCSSV